MDKSTWLYLVHPEPLMIKYVQFYQECYMALDSTKDPKNAPGNS